MKNGGTVRRAGFTLIELLVVIAIIAILAAMLLGSLVGAKKQAQSVYCKNNLRQWALSMQMYISDFKAYPAYVYTDLSAGDWSYSKWQGKLRDYHSIDWTNRSCRCPAYTGALSDADGGDISLGSYAYNTFGVTDDPQDGTPLLAGFGLSPNTDLTNLLVEGFRRESEVVAPSATFAIMDTIVWYSDPRYANSGEDWIWCIKRPNPGTYDIRYNVPVQHGKYFNVVCCDDHVDAVRVTSLFDPSKTAQNWNVDHKPHAELW